MKRVIFRSAPGVLVVLLLAACHDNSLKGWVAKTPEDRQLMFAPELAQDAVVPVADKQMPEAVSLLAATPWLSVQPDEVRKLCACQPKTTATDGWYLVRAIHNGIRGGRYGVRGQGGIYNVYYGVLSHQRGIAEKASVLLKLPAPPKAIFAGTSVVE
jgi:hypothetical protein